VPTYEYECKSCGYYFEKFESINNSDRVKCPACGGDSKRLISGGVGLIFKGSGFYITDYKKTHINNNSGNGSKVKKEKNKQTKNVDNEKKS